jgi:hypothetical protein
MVSENIRYKRLGERKCILGVIAREFDSGMYRLIADCSEHIRPFEKLAINDPVLLKLLAVRQALQSRPRVRNRCLRESFDT